MSLTARSSGYQFCARLCQSGLGTGASSASDADSSAAAPSGEGPNPLQQHDAISAAVIRKRFCTSCSPESALASSMLLRTPRK